MPKIFTFSTFINNNQLGPYLTGLIEGDGSFFVPDYPNKRDNKNRLIYPSLQISCHSKDLPLFIMLQKILKNSLNDSAVLIVINEIIFIFFSFIILILKK